MEGQMEGHTLFYRTLPAEAECPITQSSNSLSLELVYKMPQHHAKQEKNRVIWKEKTICLDSFTCNLFYCAKSDLSFTNFHYHFLPSKTLKRLAIVHDQLLLKTMKDYIFLFLTFVYSPSTLRFMTSFP